MPRVWRISSSFGPHRFLPLQNPSLSLSASSARALLTSNVGSNRRAIFRNRVIFLFLSLYITHTMRAWALLLSIALCIVWAETESRWLKHIFELLPLFISLIVEIFHYFLACWRSLHVYSLYMLLSPYIYLPFSLYQCLLSLNRKPVTPLISALNLDKPRFINISVLLLNRIH